MTSSKTDSDSVNTFQEQLDPDSAQCGNCLRIKFSTRKKVHPREKQLCEYRSQLVTRFGSCLDFKRRTR